MTGTTAPSEGRVALITGGAGLLGSAFARALGAQGAALHVYHRVPVTIADSTFTENTSAGNTINWATDVADFTPGTDAAQIFGGKLNLTGNMSYNDAPGWSLDLKFSNLDPAAAYTFAATVPGAGAR